MAYHLTHEDSDAEIEVDTDRVPMYLSQGWETKPGAKPPVDTTTTPATADKE